MRGRNFAFLLGLGAAPTPGEQHAIDKMNEYRDAAGVAPLVFDEHITTFSNEAATELSEGGAPHDYFRTSDLWSRGFCHSAAENQAPGWTGESEDAVVDAILQSMMDEGPGGGHHDNILAAQSKRVGVGLVWVEGRLYFSSDFSGACD